jgi:molybdate transport system ATP-binding protein
MERALSFEIERRFARGPLVSARAELPLDGGLVTVLFGPSGAGKTTVLRALAGLDRPDAGFVRFEGETWFDARSGDWVSPQLRRIGLLFQDYALFPHLSAAANVAYGLHGVERAERGGRVRRIAAQLRISELLDRRPGQLSGGQRQRVALARALALAARLLLLDEPLSALDAPARAELRGELRRTLEASGVPAIVVTHDRVEALSLGDRMVVLVDGTVRQIGPVHDVFSAPASVEVAKVVGTENVLPVRLARRIDGLAGVRAGGVELVGLDPGDLADEAYACIRAEEIVLEEAPGAPSSAQNLLPGTITARADEGPLVRVRIDCGIPLVALVTHASAERLHLAPGRRIVALVKAPSVRLVPRSGP